jgi:hypothetical protein
VRSPVSCSRSSAGRFVDRRGRAQQDSVGGRDGVVPGGGERDQLAAPVIGVRAAFDQAVSFQLVDDQRCVGGVDAVDLRELAKGHRSVAELKQDLSPSAAQPESERLGELASAVVSLDEPLHESPGLLWCRVHHATVRPR